VLAESILSTDQEKVETVQRVGKRIAEAAGKVLADSGRRNQIKSYQWEFIVIENDKMVNAFGLPDGKVVLFTGMFRYIRDESELAVVIGHEVAHIIAGHSNERMSRGLSNSSGNDAVICYAKRIEKETEIQNICKYNAGTLTCHEKKVNAETEVQQNCSYPRRTQFSKLILLQEYEADRIGLILMAKAGFDPNAAIHFWQKMKKREGNRNVGFLSNHPDSASRIADFKLYIPEALSYYQMSEN